MGKIYYCQNCGGIMEFDVASQALKCPNCDTVAPIENDRKKVVEHKLTRHAMETIKVEEKTSHTMECHGCGAVVEVDANSTASRCPYCDSSFVLAEKQIASLIPDGVLPFQIDKSRVGEIFRNWMKGRWLAPGELKHLYQQDRLQGIYIPYWTFDADVNCPYTAQGGRNRTETYRDKEGKTQTRIVTDWFFTSGVVSRFFDDVLVKASDKLKAGLLAGIEPYYTKEVASYSPDYFSGYVSECYSIELEAAHRKSHDIIENRLESLVREDVLRRYDCVKNIHITPSYKDETYKHILLPVYATSYNYKGKSYTVLINGQNGKIQGDYPKSPIKIALLIIAGIILLTALYFLFASEDSNAGYHSQIYHYSAYNSKYGEDDGKEVYDGELAYQFEFSDDNEEERQWDYLDHNLLT